VTSQTGRHPRPDADQDEADNKSTSSSSQRTGEDSGAKRSGRVAFDDRGNSVWEWKTEDDEFSRDVNTHYIKKLEAPELTLDEGDKGVIDRQSTDGKDKLRAGFNPYARASAPGESKNGTMQTAPTDAQKKPIKDLRRYNEWVKLKQRMAEKKDDE